MVRGVHKESNGGEVDPCAADIAVVDAGHLDDLCSAVVNRKGALQYTKLSAIK